MQWLFLKKWHYRIRIKILKNYNIEKFLKKEAGSKKETQQLINKDDYFFEPQNNSYSRHEHGCEPMPLQ